MFEGEHSSCIKFCAGLVQGLVPPVQLGREGRLIIIHH